MELLKELLSKGILIEPSALGMLKSVSESSSQALKSRIEQERPLVLTKELLEIYMKSHNFFVIKEFSFREKVSMQNYVNQLNERYRALQGILVGKVELENLVSINKLGFGKSSVIGLVKTKERAGDNDVIEVEDPTGSVACVVQPQHAERIAVDDLVAVTGNLNNKIFFAENVIWPDVPLRQPVLSDKRAKVAFVADHDFFSHLKGADADFVFHYNCKNIHEAKNSFPFAKIVSVDVPPVYVNVDGVNLLFTGPHDPMEALRRRFISIRHQDFVIDPAPDIVFHLGDLNTNYKGVTVIGKNSVVDLLTRDAKLMV